MGRLPMMGGGAPCQQFSTRTADLLVFSSFAMGNATRRRALGLPNPHSDMPLSRRHHDHNNLVVGILTNAHHSAYVVNRFREHMRMVFLMMLGSAA